VPGSLFAAAGFVASFGFLVLVIFLVFLAIKPCSFPSGEDPR
jgi:hypothetical protein